MTPDGKLLVDGSLNVLGDLEVGGDLKVGKTLSAKEVNTEKINVSTPGVDSNGKSKDSIGTATIAAGQTEIVVETTAVTDKSRVFVTATTSTGGQSIYVSEQTDKEGFTVKLDQPLTTDVKFNWWVVN